MTSRALVTDFRKAPTMAGGPFTETLGYFHDPVLAFPVCLLRPFGFSAGTTGAGTSG